MSERIAVAINVHLEPHAQVAACLRRIARNLPGACVQVLINGTERPDIEALARGMGYCSTRGENLGRNSTWHLWWTRMLEFFRNSGASLCFKMDPDTMVDAPPHSFPDAHYFGTVFRGFDGLPFVQGGVTGLSAEAVRRLLVRRLQPPKPRPWQSRGHVSSLPFADDQLLAEALAQLAIHPTFWSECKSSWGHPVLNDPVTHALIHPRYYGLGNQRIPDLFTGNWHDCVPGRQPCRIVLRVVNSDDEALGVIIRVGKEKEVIAVDSIEQHGATLALSIKRLDARFSAEINEEGTELAGSWSQPGSSTTLNLRRADSGVDMWPHLMAAVCSMW